jgi:hypothetical protein
MTEELHRRRRRGSSKLTSKKRLLTITGTVCLGYFLAYMGFHSTGDAEKPDGFIQSDLNYFLRYTTFICYIVYMATAIKSYFLESKYSKQFRVFHIGALLLTAFFVVLLVLLLMNSVATGSNEFMLESSQQ